VVLCVKAKGKIHLYSTTFAHTAISGAVITGRAAVQPSLQQAKLSHMDFDHMATRSHSLPYSCTHPRGMESWVRLVDWPMAESLPTRWSPVNHRSGAGQGKFDGQRPTS